MFGSGALEMAIGLVFVYFVLSLICTAIREIIESWLKTRAVDLENGIRELLNDPGGSGLTRKVFEHPMIYGLFRGGYTPPGEGKLYKRGSNLPSYIPPQSFALAIMDIIMPAPAGQAAAAPMRSRSFAGSIDNISNEKVKEALRTIVQSAGDDVNKVKEGIEVWFNSTMERVSGWYKQRTQKAVFVIAILVAFSMNADTISIARSLAANATIRSTVVQEVDKYIGNINSQGASAADKKGPEQQLTELLSTMGNLSLPIGWNTDAAVPPWGWGWFTKIIGLLLTAMAISLGAPVWFDFLNRMINLRASLKPQPGQTSLQEGAKGQIEDLLSTVSSLLNREQPQAPQPPPAGEVISPPETMPTLRKG